MKKGNIYQGYVERIAFPNLGKVFIPDENDYIIVKNLIPGQEVKVALTKYRRGVAKGRLMEVVEPSPLERREPVCSIFPQCGGCTYQTMNYDSQLDLKRDQMLEVLDKVANYSYDFGGVLPAPNEFNYRNKMEFSFGDEIKDGPLSLGLHKKDSRYDILNALDCQLVHPDMTLILQCVLEYFQNRNVSYYKKMQHVGYLRHLLLRRGEATGEILVNLVTTTQEDYDLNSLVLALHKLNLEGEIVGVLHILNDSLSDVVKCDELRILSGRDYLNEKLMGLSFKITPFSFFQPNTLGAEIVYNVVRDYLGDVTNLTVFDLFSGTGTISQVIAPMAKKVIGVEIIEEAVVAARENAKINGLDNCHFIAGDVLKVIDDIKEIPDVIILDPPRDGVHPKVLPKILNYGVEKIVYISCKVTSFVRDLEMIHEYGYKIEKIVAIDQFSQTAHIECVTLLTRIEAT